MKEVQTSHLTSGASKTCGFCNPKSLNFGGLGEEKECILCGKKFISNNHNRQYCYDCSPEGLSRKEALRHKKHALKHFLIEYKGGKCERCGYDKCEAALQFHHKVPEEKSFSISEINLNATDFSIEAILKEVDKCSLLCANCHMEEHWLNEGLAESG